MNDSSSVPFGLFGQSSQIKNPVIVTNPDRIFIGNNVMVRDGARLEAVKEYAGVEHDPILKIGDGVSIELSVHIGAANSVCIGKDVMIGGRVTIVDHDHGFADPTKPPSHQPLNVGKIQIDDGAWLGENVVVCKNVHIGRHAVIGANSLVTTNIPAYSVAAGNPARVLRKYSSEKLVFERCLQRIANGELADLESIDLHAGGETSLLHQVDDILMVLARHRQTFPKPIYVTLLTNGMALEESTLALLTSGTAVDEIRVSVDGSSPEMFEYLRTDATWKMVSENIERISQALKNIKSRTLLRIVCTVAPDKAMDVGWMDPDFKAVIQLADELEICHPQTCERLRERIDGLPAHTKLVKWDVVVGKMDQRELPGTNHHVRSYSLIHHIRDARLLLGASNQMAIWDCAVDSRHDRVLFMQPPVRALFTVHDGAEGAFKFAVMIHPDAWEKSAAGCSFTITVDGETKRIVQSAPSVHCEDRHWDEHVIAVPEAASGKHDIILETQGLGGSTDFRWAIWRDLGFFPVVRTPRKILERNACEQP
ncbi:MAG TPA: hypothetical protein DGH68_09745 [Bacteroidetes bacterium]|jgi:acetyltransferase-like isoleucine patch superfamily enzyme|nr:hypothetical protein [Bacteroidota bacterium]